LLSSEESLIPLGDSTEFQLATIMLLQVGKTNYCRTQSTIWTNKFKNTQITTISKLRYIEPRVLLRAKIGKVGHLLKYALLPLIIRLIKVFGLDYTKIVMVMT
jgi:hypothetical protein